MKNPRTITVTMLLVIAVAFTFVSVFAFAFAAGSTAANPNATSSGTNGYYSNGMMGGDWTGMMGNMMGGNWGPSATTQTPVAAQTTVLPLIGFAALIGAFVTGAGGAVYYLAFPRIRIADAQPTTIVASSPQNATTPYISVAKTLTAEERKVLDVLVAHNGKYLQKYIRAETGLSRLKIHRIITRLAERGIVTMEKTGNTNDVHLSSWLQNKPYSNLKNDKQAEKQDLVVEA